MRDTAANVRRLLANHPRPLPQSVIVAKLVDARTSPEDVAAALGEMKRAGEASYRISPARGRQSLARAKRWSLAAGGAA